MHLIDSLDEHVVGGTVVLAYQLVFANAYGVVLKTIMQLYCNTCSSHHNIMLLIYVRHC